jgi:hypothetical protein
MEAASAWRVSCPLTACHGATDPIWMDDVQCYGDELEITHCRQAGWGEHNCGHHEDVGICCDGGSTIQFTHSTNPVELNCPGGDNGVIRMVACTPEACRVEVNYHGTYGSVCDDGFDEQDAAVACRSLGYMPQGSVQIQAFGGGGGIIWMVRCWSATRSAATTSLLSRAAALCCSLLSYRDSRPRDLNRLLC